MSMHTLTLFKLPRSLYVLIVIYYLRAYFEELFLKFFKTGRKPYTPIVDCRAGY